MSNPTTPFGWQMPTPTDLVTDLPADFEVFGQAVATSMGDLLGGTSGQILAKNSNTDMDFVWIANDQGDITGVTATSPLTGGGTSGAITVGILDGTTSNKGAVQLSTSTSSTSTSLAATASAVKEAFDPAFTNNFYAGKNKIINGDFGIWQRGTTISAGPAYTCDRWIMAQDTGTPTYSVSQQTFTPGTAPVAGYEGTFFARFGVTVVSTATTFTFLQKIEDVRQFAGQTINVSLWAKSDASRTLTIAAKQNFGSGGSATVSTTVGTASVTTSWTRFSVSVAIPTISGKTIGAGSNLEIAFSYPAAVMTNDFWGVQVEAGSTATPFQTTSGSLQGELAMCQRYFQKWSLTQFSRAGLVYADSTTNVIHVDKLSTVLRATPTLTFTNMTANGNAVTAAAVGGYLDTNNTLYLNLTTSGVVAGLMYQLYVASGQTGVISYSAEL